MGLSSATHVTSHSQPSSLPLPPSNLEPRNPTSSGLSDVKMEPKSSSTASRGSNAPHDKVPKKRGRPRLYLGDQEAADRRREQVRAAQQAYRLRKEKAITDLTERVSHLEKTISLMNKSFFEFQTSLKDSGIFSSRPELAVQLQKTQDRLMVLTADAKIDLASVIEDAKDRKPSTSTYQVCNVISSLESVVEYLQSATSVSSTTAIIPTLTAATATTASASANADITYGISTVDINPFLDSVHGRVVESNPYIMPTAPEQFLPTNNATSQYMNDYTPPSGISTPTQRHHNSAFLSEFANRVFRTCVEKAIAVLRNPKATDEYLEEKFGPLLKTFTKQQLIQTFDHLLRTGVVVLPLTSADAFFVKNWTANDWAFAMGLEEQGRWFYIHEVEQYLIQRGINVIGTSGYAWVNPELLDFTSLYESMSAEDKQTEISASASRLSSFDTGFPTPQFEFDVQQMPLGDTTGQSQNDWWKLRDVPSTVKRSLVLDISRFITELTDRAICLGRSPGFNQREVDTSIVLSIIQSI
ncbi:hypothetical protein KEM56_004298 [Ascosphaera pollenicola]|nr:hypothetical protein KEM56_004298 [Ascosphaera pollenicola]